MACREILTLQFGPYANFVGTHWWNLQSDAYSFDSSACGVDFEKPCKEVNFDCTFREGKTLNGEVTYTPRAVVYCSKDSLQSLKETGTLYDLPNTNAYADSWNTSPTLHQQESVKNKYLNDPENESMKTSADNKEEIEQTGAPVKVWSDFLKQHLHPKTVQTFKTDSESFNYHSFGVKTYSSQRDEMEDRLRFFTEECDNMQGFQILLDPSDAFSGIASAFYEDYLLDEFHNKSHLIACFMPPDTHGSKESNLRILSNSMLCYNHFSAASCIIPLSTNSSFHFKTSSHRNFPLFTYNASLPYQTSAILAAAFNTATLPYRVFERFVDMRSLYSSLAFDSKNILAFQVAYPFLTENSAMNSLPSLHFTTLTPSVDSVINSHFQHITISGLSKHQVFGTEADVIKDLVHKQLNTNTLKCSSSLFRTPLITTDPFPSFMPSSHSSHHTISSIGTSLQNTPDLSKHLNDVIKSVEVIKPHQLTGHLGGVMNLDDWTSELECLRGTCEKY